MGFLFCDRAVKRRSLLVVFGVVMGLAAGSGVKGESSPPVVEWTFDEGVGTRAHDVTGGGCHATLAGASWVKQGKGYAVRLDGEDDYIDCTSQKPLVLESPFTIEAWIKPTRKGQGEAHLFGEGVASFALTYYNTELCLFYVGGGGNNVKYPLNLDKWQQVVVTFDGKLLGMWHNGRQVASAKSKFNKTGSRGQVTIGTKGTSGGARFEGLVDQVRIYDRSLADAEILSHFRQQAAEHDLVIHQTKSAPEDVVTQFFRSHPNPIDVKRIGDSILFANQKVGLEIVESENGFHWNRLYSVELDHDFLVRTTAGGTRELIDVRMTLDPMYVGRDDSHLTKYSLMGIMDEMAGDAFSIGSSAGGKLSWRCDFGQDQAVLHLAAEKIDVRESEGVLDVDMQVTLRTDDPMSYWRVGLRNRGLRYGIERVRFPVVSFAPIGKAVDNVFVYPRERGGLVEDPFHAPTGLGSGFHTRGAFYPVDFNMQFQALYDQKSSKGVFVGTQDSTPNLTHTRIQNTPRELTWSVAHFPPNITYAEEDYAQPYDCVVGPFRGDWYDACQIYRSWALKQSWCRQGPLRTRQDVPQWYKQAPLYLYTTLADSAEGTHSKSKNMELAAGRVREWLDWSGMKLPVNLYGWERYVPGMTAFENPVNMRRMRTQGRWAGLAGHNMFDGNYPRIPAIDNFADQCQQLRVAGGEVVPYLALELFDQGPAENSPYAAEARPHITRDLYGGLRAWGGHRSWQPCAWTDWWRNRLRETTELMLEREHVGGFYLDVMQGAALPCYWPGHGHAAAGADVATTGMHELVATIHRKVKSKNREAIITGENSTENMIDVIDGILQLTLWPETKAPLFATVYQDYVLRFGLELSTGTGWQERFKDEWRKDHFFLESASLFAEGMQIGMVRLPPRDNALSHQNPDHREMIDFLGKLVGYYRQEVSRNFLSVGQFMRPVTFDKPAVMPTIVYKEGIEFPAVQSGVFRDVDGRLAVFVVNAGANPVTYRAELDLVQYGMPADAKVAVETISWEGVRTKIAGGSTSPVELAGTLSGRDVVMLHIEP